MTLPFCDKVHTGVPVAVGLVMALPNELVMA